MAGQVKQNIGSPTTRQIVCVQIHSSTYYTNHSLSIFSLSLHCSPALLYSPLPGNCKPCCSSSPPRRPAAQRSPRRLLPCQNRRRLPPTLPSPRLPDQDHPHRAAAAHSSRSQLARRQRHRSPTAEAGSAHHRRTTWCARVNPLNPRPIHKGKFLQLARTLICGYQQPRFIYDHI